MRKARMRRRNWCGDSVKSASRSSRSLTGHSMYDMFHDTSATSDSWSLQNAAVFANAMGDLPRAIALQTEAVRTLTAAGRPEDIITINEHGFHDTEFPREKPPGQLRGLMLGDSVTMGYGVTYAETFSAKLEEMLAEDTSPSKLCLWTNTI